MPGKLKTKLTGEIIFALILTALGIIWIINGLKMGIWDRIAPAGGFMLLLIGLPTSILGISIALQQTKLEANQSGIQEQERKSVLFIFAGSIAGIVLMNYVLGTMITLTIFIALWLKLYAKFNWLKTCMITIIVMLAIYGMFVAWLQVRFPTFLNLGIL